MSNSKINNLQDQSKVSSSNQLNTIQGNSNENISPDNSEIQSINNTLSATTMDDKQKMLLMKIANNENDYGNVSYMKEKLLCNFY